MKSLILLIVCLFFSSCITGGLGSNRQTNITPIKNSLPVAPELEEVNFQNINGNFCFETREDVQKYLKNQNLKDGYIKQLEKAIEELIKFIESNEITI